MIDPDQEIRLYRLLEDRLEKLAHSIGYFEDPIESPEYKNLEGSWRSYLDSIGVRVVPSDFQPEENVYMSSDPLYTTGERLILPWDLVHKILVVGLP